MPIYAYEVREGSDGCERCRRGFEVLQSLREAPIARCPDCGAPVERVPALAGQPAQVPRIANARQRDGPVHIRASRLCFLITLCYDIARLRSSIYCAFIAREKAFITR